MGQIPPFVFVNLVVVFERAFVSMAGVLNDLVPWLSGFLRFCNNRLSGGMIGNSLCQGSHNAAEFVIVHLVLCAPNFGIWTLYYGQGTEVRVFDERILRNSSKSLTGSLELSSVVHIS